MAIIKSFTDIINDLKADMVAYGSKFSDLNQGSRIASLMKAFASSLSLAWIGLAQISQTFYVSTASGSDLAARVTDLGMVPGAGTQAAGALLGFTTSTATIPAGALLQTADGLVIVEVAQAKTITAPFTAIPVIAAQVGVIGNLAAGTVLTVTDGTLSSITFRVGSTGVDINNNPTGPLVGGTDPESDVAVRNRFPLYLKTLSRATLDAVTQALEAIPGITSLIVQNATPTPGWITISLTDGSSSVSSATRAAIDAAMASYGPVGMGYLIKPITQQGVVLLATAYTKDTSQAPATIKAAVVAALAAYNGTLSIGDPINIADIYKNGKITGLDNFIIQSPLADTPGVANVLLNLTLDTNNVTVVYS